jgi:amino acid adenylation domain-containing protein
LSPCLIVCLEDEQETIGRQDDKDLAISVDALDTAYIMYTSGSTGQPKGVRVPHRAINRLVLNTNYFRAGPGEAMAHISNPAFDASTFEVWGALLNDARLVVYDKDMVLSPGEFAASIQKDGISIMFMTAQLFSLFAREAPDAFKNVRDMLVGGEAVDPISAKLILAHGPPQRLINAYGPTENTTFSICYHIEDVSAEDGIPIGRPISNSTAYILDGYLQPVPVGVIGEIYLGGDGIAEGYHERPDLNEIAFIPDPFAHELKRTLYRTGDLGCFMPDGNLRYLGRRDTQVKIRGFRVEPDEVKAVLSTYPSIRAALVTTKEVNGEKQLIAYLMTRCDEMDIEALREYVRKRLPEYMVPSYFMILEEFPLTAMGKIDHRALPMPGIDDRDRQSVSEEPRDELEQALAKIWVEVLDVNSVSINDNFFNIGGHSLASVRMFAKVEAEIGVKLPISMIFTSSTIRSMAQTIRENNKSHLWQCIVPLKPEGVKPSLFCVHTVSCMLGEYNSLVKCLNIRQSIYGIQPVGLDGSDPPLESIEAMAAHYVKEIRAFQPQGPYLLMGYSSGGIIAYEMARQLREQGLEVSLLCLIEPYLRNRDYYNIKYAVGLQSLKTLAGGSITVLMHLLRIKTSRTLIMPPMMDNITTIIPYRISKALKLHTPVLWIYPDWVLTMHEPQRQVAIKSYDAYLRYFPVKHTGSAVFFISQSLVERLNGTAVGWEKLIGNKLEVIPLPGDHVSMMQPPIVELLARDIERKLDNVRYERPIKPAFKASDMR